MTLLLCDLDGTVVDRAAAFRRWAEMFCETHELPVGAVEWLIEQDEDGYCDRSEFFEAAVGRFGLGAAHHRLAERYVEEFTALFRCEVDVVGALQRARHGGWKIAIVTNGSPAQLKKVEAARLDDLVDAVCVSSIENAWKPDPRLLEIAAARCGAALDGAWMIGDNAEADIGAAVAAGVDSVWLRRGRSWPDLDYGPTHEADTFPAAVEHAVATTLT